MVRLESKSGFTLIELLVVIAISKSFFLPKTSIWWAKRFSKPMSFESAVTREVLVVRAMQGI